MAVYGPALKSRNDLKTSTIPARRVNRRAASAATEFMRGIIDKDSWYRSIIEQFATELDAAGAFDDMSWADARVVATVIVQDITGMGHPRTRLQRRSRNIIRRAMRYDNSGPWDDPHTVLRAVTIAASLAKSRVFGLPTPPL